MKIGFKLIWPSKGADWQRAFKSKEAKTLFSGYLIRIAHAMPCDAKCFADTLAFSKKDPRAKVWFCERNEKSAHSSEEIANSLQNVMFDGVSELQIVIGGPDGLKKEEISIIKPDFLWSFGSLTLPHELAAVVAAEQIYRAGSILKNLPYHKSH